MRAAPTLGIALLLLAGAVTGCSTDRGPLSPAATTGTSADQVAVATALAAVPQLVDDAVFGDSTQFALGAAPAGALALIRPLHYWRDIRSVDRDVATTFSDPDSTGRPTTAHVSVRRFLRGAFDILSMPADTDTVELVRKPLGDLWRRNLLLKRVVDPSDSSKTEWRVAATSGVRVASFDPRSADASPAFGTTQILSLRLQAGTIDTTITDPLALFRLRSIIRVNAGDAVTITANTGRTGDVVVLLSRGLRSRFQGNGDGTYTGVWIAPDHGGLGHVGVNAMTRGTLFDDTAPYDSQAWVLPFVIRGEELSEYMP
jgi:hypothetical protein